MTDNADNNNSSCNKQHILWSSVARDDVILAEAGHDNLGGAVAETARQLLARKGTAGWEFHTQQHVGGLFRKSRSSTTTASAASNNNNKTRQSQQKRLKGIKFHLYDTANTTDDETAPPRTFVWVFCAVYDPSLIDKVPVQSFLEKMIGISALFRETDQQWLTGGTLACQAQFAPILLQRMQDVTSLGKMAMLSEQLTETQDLMRDNITQILENEEQLHELAERGTRLQEMSHVFKKKSKALRRAKMMQNAKHGVILGTAITAGVAIVVVPPLVALL